MDDYEEYDEEQKLEAVSSNSSYPMRYHFLKKTFQLVLSVALLSFFLCHSTYYSGFSSFPHSFSVYFSTVLFSFFTRTLDRKYMFLICNGILAFLARSSVSSCSSSPPEPDFGSQTSTSSINSTRTEASVSDKGVIRLSDDGDYDAPIPLAEGEEGVYYDSLGTRVEVREEEEKGENEVSVVVEEEEYEEGESGSSVHEGEEGTGTATENEEVVSTEELNRKFEEFIRKMKEEIRIEAQQQLIAV